MKKIHTILVSCVAVGLLIARPAIAEDNLYSKQFGICTDKTNGSTFAILDCIHQEVTRQDKKLNANYKKAMALIGEQIGKEGQDTLRQAQRAWLKWRDQDNGVYVQFYNYYGDTARINANGDYLEKTARRVRDLENMIKMME